VCLPPFWRTLPCPSAPGQRHRLQGDRLADPDVLPEPVLAIQRKVSSSGGIQVGMTHAGQTVTIQLGDTSLRVIDQQGELLTTVPLNGTGEISGSRQQACWPGRPQIMLARYRCRPASSRACHRQPSR
jgi:hypothetical protein